MISAFIATAPCDAQHGTGEYVVDAQAATATIPPLLPAMPLTVHPHELTLGTTTPHAGVYQLDSLTGYVVYVPAQCVGTHRCPLVIFLHGAGENGTVTTDVWRPVSDTYGMISLAPTGIGEWQLKAAPQNHQNVDAALLQVLTHFAIDTTHIALMGNSAAGGATMAFGGYRLDLFSRLMLISSDFSIATIDPKNRTSQFFLSCSIHEAHDCLSQGTALRTAGHPVAYDFALREDDSYAPEDILGIGHWLHESWTILAPSARPRPHVVLHTVPRLTTTMMTKLTTFWRKFMAEPDSIRKTARLARLRLVAVPIAGEVVSVLMTDIPALAARYPAVAADLKAAGLTAQQHEAYRITLISARIDELGAHGTIVDGPHPDVPGVPRSAAVFDSIDRLFSSGPPPLTIDAASMQGKNVQFLMTHTGLLQELATTGIWETP